MDTPDLSTWHPVDPDKLWVTPGDNVVRFHARTEPDAPTLTGSVSGAAGETMKITELAVASPNGLTGAVLRSVNVGGLTARIQSYLAEHPDLLTGIDAEHLDPYLGSGGLLEEAAETLLGRPPLHAEHHYREVAVAYLNVQRGGVTRGITDILAEQFSVTRTKMARWIRKARELEYLTPGTKGRAGASAGRALIAYNQQHEDTVA